MNKFRYILFAIIFTIPLFVLTSCGGGDLQDQSFAYDTMKSIGDLFVWFFGGATPGYFSIIGKVWGLLTFVGSAFAIQSFLGVILGIFMAVIIFIICLVATLFLVAVYIIFFALFMVLAIILSTLALIISLISVIVVAIF